LREQRVGSGERAVGVERAREHEQQREDREHRHDERDEVTPSGVGEPAAEAAPPRGGAREGCRRGHRWISSRALVLEKLTTAMIATMRKMMIENADARP